MKKTCCAAAALAALALALADRLGMPIFRADATLPLLTASACIGIALLLRSMIPEMHVGLVLGIAGGWAAMLIGMDATTDAPVSTTLMCMTAALSATTWVLIGFARYRTPLPPLLCFFGLLTALKAPDAGALHGAALLAGGVACLLLTCAAALGTPARQGT